ncbi:conserved hypothetical protein [Anaeromyxobacter sp. Fw109-5]|nr:conserved hypothetical protein [Anaeromyxobacter sp. Fw109-5]
MEPLAKELASREGGWPGNVGREGAKVTHSAPSDAAADGPGLGADAPAAHSSSMAGASQGWHEREELLSARTKDLHRALVSLQEELEAIDWYQQRIDATEDPELRHILEHNRDEEKEHASMILEWIRRRDVAFARMLRMHTGHSGPIVSGEEEEEAAGEADVERRGEKGKR